MEDKALIQYGLGNTVGKRLGVFYIDNGILVLQDPEQLQRALNALIELFQSFEFSSNVGKLKMMMCQTGDIRLGLSKEVFGRRSTGDAATYQERLRKKRRAQTVGWR